MYSVTDIEVFIASHNRKEYISETIDSFLAQSIKGFDITVLDNSDSDEVIKFLRKYEEQNIIVIPGNLEEIDGMDNFLRAKRLASKKWVILFHDDDIIHPQFIEHVLYCVNNNDCNLITSLTLTTKDPSNKKWRKLDMLPKRKVYTKQEFVTEMFKGIHVPFCSIVYKTDGFKQMNIDFDLYGKIADRPFVFDCIRDGKVCHMNNIYAQTRIHGNRDTIDSSSGPYREQWFELIKKYKEIMGSSFCKRSGRTFINRATRTLLITMNDKYIIGAMNNKEYINLAIQYDAISKKCYYMGLPYYYLYKIAKSILKHIFIWRSH
jgi:glycosyltransferase involved in cell wall biosynthesis